METIYAKELMERWKMNDLNFVDFVANHLPSLYGDNSRAGNFLLPYQASTSRPVDSDLFDSREGRAYIRNRLFDVFFYHMHVDPFEKAHPELLKAKGGKKAVEGKKQPRPDQRHRVACRKVAKELWKKDRSITISAMAERDEINRLFDGKVYQPATIRTWIKDLCPNRLPGRRKKT
jgi:hypothetical protein